MYLSLLDLLLVSKIQILAFYKEISTLIDFLAKNASDIKICKFFTIIKRGHFLRSFVAMNNLYKILKVP